MGITLSRVHALYRPVYHVIQFGQVCVGESWLLLLLQLACTVSLDLLIWRTHWRVLVGRCGSGRLGQTSSYKSNFVKQKVHTQEEDLVSDISSRQTGIHNKSILNQLMWTMIAC